MARETICTTLSENEREYFGITVKTKLSLLFLDRVVCGTVVLIVCTGTAKRFFLLPDRVVCGTMV